MVLLGCFLLPHCLRPIEGNSACGELFSQAAFGLIPSLIDAAKQLASEEGKPSRFGRLKFRRDFQPVFSFLSSFSCCFLVTTPILSRVIIRFTFLLGPVEARRQGLCWGSPSSGF